MPPPVNLSGRRFGDLTVIRKVGINPDAKTLNTIWLCHCERCGRDEEIMQLRIPYCPNREARSDARWSCTICWRGPCQICGEEILSDTYRGVCSEACHLERRRLRGREFHKRRVEENPDHYTEMARARRKSIEADPAKLEAFREKQRERNKLRRATDPEALNAKARELYHRNKEAIQQRRRDKIAAMPEEDRIRLENEAREYRKAHWAKNRDRIRAARAEKSANLTPEQIEQRRERVRLSHRKHRARMALTGMMRDSSKLMEHHNDTTDDQANAD